MPRCPALLAIALLFALTVPAVPARSGDMPADKTFTLSSDQGSITVSAGAKYIMPQSYKGSDAIFNGGTALKTADSDYSTPDSILGPSITLSAERATSLELPGLSDIRLVGEFSYSGGSARSTGIVTPGAGDYLLFLSVDPAYNWVGGIGPAGAAAATRVSISEDNFDLWLGLEGKGTAWGSDAGGATAAPVFGAGLYAATQRYKVSTRVEGLGAADHYAMVESIRTTDIGPELRAGLEAQLPGGATFSAMASAAALVGWADLDASQQWSGISAWMPGTLSPTHGAKRSVNDVLFSGLFGLTLRGEVPVAEQWSLGLEASGRIWTSRPTIENPRSIGGTGQVSVVGGTNTGVRMGQDSASELGAALNLGYSF